MDRNRAAGRVDDGTEFHRATGETTPSPGSPTYDLTFLSLESDTFQPPQYPSITPESLSPTSLDPAAYGYFSSPPGTQSFGSGVSAYGFTAFPESDWPEPSYFSEATSSAPFTTSELHSGFDPVSPESLADNTADNSCNYGAFLPIPRGAGPASLGSGPAPISPSSPPERSYAGQPLGSATGIHNDVPGTFSESKSTRGTTSITKRRISPSAARVPQPRGSMFEIPGEKSGGGGTGSKIQLRTAFRKAKTKKGAPHSLSASGRKSGPEEEEEQGDTLTAEERRARNSHNIVEKQYRNRLNAQFVRLLSILPAEQRNGSSGDDSTPSDNSPGEEKRVSKAEVLDLAARRIKALEEERVRLERENNELMRNVNAMTSTVVSRELGQTE